MESCMGLESGGRLYGVRIAVWGRVRIWAVSGGRLYGVGIGSESGESLVESCIWWKAVWGQNLVESWSLMGGGQNLVEGGLLQHIAIAGTWGQCLAVPCEY